MINSRNEYNLKKTKQNKKKTKKEMTFIALALP